MRDCHATLYLDRSGWDELLVQAHSEAAVRLRQLASDGDIRILASHELLEEIAGLTHGWEAAIDHLRGFPNVVLSDRTRARDLWRRDVETFAAEVLQMEAPDSISIQFIPLTKSKEWFVQQRQCSRLIHAVRDAGTELERDVRAADAGVSKDDRLASERAGADLTEAVIETRLAMADPDLRADAKWALDQGRARGLLPPAEARLDPEFRWLVQPNLPETVRKDPQAMREIGGAWRDHARQIPSVWTSAAVVRWVHYRHVPTNSKDPFSTNDQLDMEHAAYAPLVDVFTCDKRTAPLVCQAMKALEQNTEVVRATKLDEIVHHCEARRR